MKITEEILIVDDDPNILRSLKRNLRKEFSITCIEGGELALEAMRVKEFAVVLSDQRMPGMNGVDFLAQVREKSPDTVRMMLTGAAELEEAVDAINRGSIFRFLTKPCSPEDVGLAFSAALEQHRLIRAEQELLEKTLGACIRVLVDILSLVSPEAFGRAMRTRRLVKGIAKQLGLRGVSELEMAALLSSIGCVSIPPELLKRAYSQPVLSEEDKKTLAGHPEVGAKLLKKIPRLEKVTRLVAHQKKPIQDKEDPIFRHNQVLTLCLDYDQKWKAEGLSSEEAIRSLREDTLEKAYQESVLKCLEDTVLTDEGKKKASTKEIEHVLQLQEGQVIAQDVFTKGGLLLLSQGFEVSQAVLARLRLAEKNTPIRYPIRVYLPEEEG